MPDPVWQGGASERSIVLSDFSGRPFAIRWQANLAELTPWEWTPPNATIHEPIVGKAFFRLWRYDYAVEAIWQGSPEPSPILADFASRPFAKLWRYDLAELTPWMWTPPDASIRTKPFSKFWRYDYAVEAVWQGHPEASATIVALVARPFSKPWRYDLAELLSWEWLSVNSALVPPAPFSKLWRYDYAVEAVWQGSPIAALFHVGFVTVIQVTLSQPVIDTVGLGDAIVFSVPDIGAVINFYPQPLAPPIGE